LVLLLSVADKRIAANGRVQARGGCGAEPSRANPFVRVPPPIAAAKPRRLQPMLAGYAET